MAGNFQKKIQADNRHLENLTSARFFYVDGSVTTPITVSAGPCRLLRVLLNTNGATLNVRDGSRPIANIALDAPEGDFDYGIYCENSLVVQAGGAGDWTVVFD